MREIKFRVYDIDGNKMSDGFDIEKLACGEEDIQFPKTDESLPWKDFVFFREEFSNLMQFTGLKDSKGVDIYEGDIVRNWQGGWNIVVYKSPAFEATVSEDQSSLYTVEWWNKTEIIGNIYEHPHLLRR